MKKVIDGIYLRCLVHSTEDVERVKKAMRFISGYERFNVETLKGYHGNVIIDLSLTLTKNQDILRFMKRLKDMGITDLIVENLNYLMDDDGEIHTRFDKQEAYMERVALTSGGDAITMKIKVLSYPKRREMAIKNFKEFIEMIQSSQQ